MVKIIDTQSNYPMVAPGFNGAQNWSVFDMIQYNDQKEANREAQQKAGTKKTILGVITAAAAVAGAVFLGNSKAGKSLISNFKMNSFVKNIDKFGVDQAVGDIASGKIKIDPDALGKAITKTGKASKLGDNVGVLTHALNDSNMKEFSTRIVKGIKDPSSVTGLVEDIQAKGLIKVSDMFASAGGGNFDEIASIAKKYNLDANEVFKKIGMDNLRASNPTLFNEIADGVQRGSIPLDSVLQVAKSGTKDESLYRALKTVDGRSKVAVQLQDAAAKASKPAKALSLSADLGARFDGTAAMKEEIFSKLQNKELNISEFIAQYSKNGGKTVLSGKNAALKTEIIDNWAKTSPAHQLNLLDAMSTGDAKQTTNIVNYIKGISGGVTTKKGTSLKDIMNQMKQVGDNRSLKKLEPLVEGTQGMKYEFDSLNDLTKILNKHEESVQKYGKAYYRINDFISEKGIKDYDDKILDNLAGLKRNKAVLTQVEDAFERGDNLTRRSILNAMSESSDVNALLSNSKFKNTLESYKQLTSRFKGDDLDEIVEKINDFVDAPATVEGIGGIAQGLARDYSVKGALKALGYNIPGGGKISGIGEEVKRSFFGSIIDGIKSIIG